jgi:hypothetical protein
MRQQEHEVRDHQRPQVQPLGDLDDEPTPRVHVPRPIVPSHSGGREAASRSSVLTAASPVSVASSHSFTPAHASVLPLSSLFNRR